MLVTGATGFIGHAVVRELRARGHEIRISSRDSEKARTCFPGVSEFVKWNPTEGPIPAEALEGIEGVLHLAGEPVAARRWSSRQKMRIRDSRVLGTRHFWQRIAKMRATGKAMALKTVVAGSAIGFYGDRGDELLTESSAPGTGFLAEVCRQWESEIFKPGIDVGRGIRQVAVRTGVVLGLGGGALTKLLPVFRLGAGGPVGTGRQWMSWIHVDDIARLFVEALENDAYQGVINGVAPGPVSNREFGKTLAQVLRRPALLPVPAPALRLAMGEMSHLVLDSQRVSSAALEGLGFRFRFSQLEPALKSLCKSGPRQGVDQQARPV